MILTLLVPAIVSAQSVEDSLQRLHPAYVKAREGMNAGELVRLDADIRRLVNAAPSRLSMWSVGSSVARDLGLRFDRHGEHGLYSGKLLSEARSIDPDSRNRAYTSFAAVFPTGRGRRSVPSPSAAHEYLKEFPGGPFAEEATLTLCRFYDDLFKVLRWRRDGGVPRVPVVTTIDDKHECYAKYVTTEPFDAQVRRAQNEGVSLYRRVAQRRPNDRVVSAALAALEAGTATTWFYCLDP